MNKLKKEGLNNVIITLGKAGAYVYHNGKLFHVPALKTQVIDTTAAGDTFVGVFISHFNKGIIKAVEISSITVSCAGAQTSIPFEKEIFKKMKNLQFKNAVIWKA